MNEFLFYLKEGIRHITDPNGLDHMLFVVTLCAVYKLEEWKKILILVTAFTIGHSITLALSSFNIVQVNQQLVETLIPVTILMTSIYNVARNPGTQRRISFNYYMALFFGLIHGMGFSNYFRAMLMGISEGSVTRQLFGFNLGVEIGQIIIVAVFMAALFLFTRVLNRRHHSWNLYISGAGGGVAVVMIIEGLM